MRVCFTTDLHGRPELYDQLDQLVRGERPEVLIVGGDMLADGDIDDPVGTQVAYVHNVFMRRVEGWQREVPGLIVACILGNHDWLCAWIALQTHHDAGRIVLLDHRQAWPCAGVWFLGYSKTPPTPYWVKDFERLDLPGDPMPETGGAVWDLDGQCVRKALPREHFGEQASLAVELEAAARLDGRWVFVCHAPPHASNLDRLPHVDHPVGSRAVRQFIEQRQPTLSLHGHIHESPDVSGSYTDRIGECTSANPGQGREHLQAVLFETRDPVGTLRHTVFA